MTAVSVIDYGVGNLFSVGRALEHCGASVTMVHDAAGVAAAERLVLPGVGAFADGMAGLQERGLVPALRAYAAAGRPLLGICLGMQMLLDGSEEFGQHEGLGIIPGTVVTVPPTGLDGRPHKIPHIGWNALRLSESRSDWNGTALRGIEPGACAYFVHSYMAAPTHAADRLADCLYDGRIVSAAIARDGVIGCQFHPEKSAATGLSVLAAFLAGSVA
jgi:imidazole glycerol-phosphate synthase subunit HisH